MQVVTEKLELPPLTLQNPDGKRLMTVDIGTTTIAMQLYDMTGKVVDSFPSVNPQVSYGADVLSRIEAAKDPGKAADMQKKVRDLMEKGVQRFSKKLQPKETLQMVVAANTTMTYLFMGWNPEELGKAPFTVSHSGAVETEIAGVACHIIPGLSAFVGGDITAGTLVSMIWNKPEFNLFIDLGTNGEIVFGNSDFMMSCACSAGPAFEGGDISCGMRATDGAIEACTIDKETMEPTYKIVGDPGTKPVGLCGSGIIDVISELYICGIINPKGKFIREGKRIKHDKYGMGSYILAFEEEAGSVKDVEITEVDIDNFIRAKGAIFSAIRTMLTSLDFDVSMIDDVYVAGGIGSGINMQNAVNIGMFPDIPIEKFHYIGNSSLTGAYLMLLSTPAEKKTYELAANMTYMELSTVPIYMDEFVGACFIPHTDTSMFPTVMEEVQNR